MAIARQYCPRWRWGAHAQPQEAYVSLQGNSRRHTQGGWDLVDATKMYLINLSDEERQMLLEMTRKGEIKARKFKRAMILLEADEGLTDQQIMAAVNVSRPCVERIRKRFLADGIERTLNEDPRPGQKRKFDDRAEATLIAAACGEAPEGHEHRTLRLLAGKLLQLGVVDTVRTKR